MGGSRSRSGHASSGRCSSACCWTLDALCSVDRLLDDLWSDDVPDTAIKMVQIYVSGLRKVLGAARLQTQPSGYRLELGPDDELDLHVLERLAAEGGWRSRRPTQSRRPAAWTRRSPCGGAMHSASSDRSRSPWPRPTGSRICGSPRWRIGSRPGSPWARRATSSAGSRPYRAAPPP